MPFVPHAQRLEDLYRRYNRREFVHPDPLEFVYLYDDPADQEVVGLVAACLAYGRVAQILRSVARVLEALGEHPAAVLRQGATLTRGRPAKWRKELQPFKHRFATGENLLALLDGVAGVLKRHGGIGRCFEKALSPSDETHLSALGRLVNELEAAGRRGKAGHLLTDPARGSACKRLNLYLRWMVRRDDVDVGCFPRIDGRKLIVPLDTHMFRIGRAMGAIGLRQANLRAAMELTRAFSRIAPADPVRYDFALSRLGIRPEADMDAFLKECGVK